MRILLAAFALVAVSVVATSSAADTPNGPIFFFGSRSADYFTEIYSVAADGSGRANLTRNPAADGGAAVSPDGSRIAFVTHRDGFDAIYVMDADGSGHRQVVGRLPIGTYRIESPVWAPTGRRLVFMAIQPPVGSFFESRLLYSADVASGRVSLLDGTGCGGGAAFSPDGRYVAFAIVECKSGTGGVRVVRPDGSAARTVGSGSLVGWAPKGARILFLRNTRNRKIQHVATVDPFGRRRWELRGAAATAAAWSPGGGLIAFSRSAGRRSGVYVVRPGARRARRVLVLAKSASIAWSPNGTWLALATARASGKGVRIYLARPSGRGLRRVSDARSLPVWSRDSRHVAFVGSDGAARIASPQKAGVLRVTDPAVDAVADRLEWDAQNRLVFESTRRGAGSAYVLAVEPDGTGVRQVTPDTAPVGRISPDGSRVTFVRDSHIWTARLDGSQERQLTSGASLDGAPAWSSDGQQIAFGRSTSSATSDIFVVDSSGGAPRQVTHNDVGFSAGGPAWSPDGSWIAFLSFGQLLAVHPDGSGRHVIASTIGLRAYGEPAWSPDGTRLALGGCGIAVVNADGSGVRELTGSGVREGQPAWSPDGTKIVFARSVTPCPSDFTADSDLWTINADGSGEKRLTDGPWPDVLPSWQPVRQ
ncbi:MAG TPA: hypothetical protein VFM83_01605 [Gaiellaceae bacterium]|nr:hypothetical protein [Gaiellaceae bacterium]